jgi:hypothetical protein
LKTVEPGKTRRASGRGARISVLLEVPGALLVERWSARKWTSRYAGGGAGWFRSSLEEPRHLAARAGELSHHERALRHRSLPANHLKDWFHLSVTDVAWAALPSFGAILLGLLGVVWSSDRRGERWFLRTPAGAETPTKLASVAPSRISRHTGTR